jgi:molybdopterin/thiamine biosynthesis adenylyltransferase
MIERYSRQQLFAPIGQEGQYKLRNSHVLLVGLGALGTVIADQFARAGIGKLTMIDRDYVEWSNLQRQTLYDESDARDILPKAIAAERKIARINSDVKLEAVVADVTSRNIEPWVAAADIVMDGTDNFTTRYLLNDAAFLYGKPFIYGAAVGSQGMSASFIPEITPCFRCLLPEVARGTPTCDTAGVIAPIVSFIASIQMTEALKWLTGHVKSIRRSLITYDIWRGSSFEINFPLPSKTCPICANRQYPSLREEVIDELVALCGRETVQITSKSILNLDEWEGTLAKIGKVSRNPFLLKVELEGNLRMILFSDGRVLIQGTDDVLRAKSLFSRFFS